MIEKFASVWTNKSAHDILAYDSIRNNDSYVNTAFLDKILFLQIRYRETKTRYIWLYLPRLHSLQPLAFQLFKR